jgi:heme-degrading monooxygenase HmoA
LALVTYGMNYEVRPGREADFEARFGAVLDALATFPGHVRSHLYRDVRAPQSYLVYSEWETREAFSAFLRSEAFNATKAWGREEILAARPEHTVFAGRERIG